MQVKRKGTKKTLKIVLIVVASILLLLVTPVMLLHISAIQNYVVQKITSKLEDELHTTVRIGHVDLSLLGTFSLEDLYIADQQGDTLLAADAARARMSMLRLFHNEIIFPSVEIEYPIGKIHINEQGEPNFKFITDLFNDTTPSNFNGALCFERVELCHGRVVFTNPRNENVTRKCKFNPADIEVDELNAVAHFCMTPDKLMTAGIDELNFTEKSGFCLTGLTSEVAKNDTAFVMSDLEMDLPHSHISIDSTVVDFDNLVRVANDPGSMQLRTRLRQSTIYFPDLQAFAPELGRLRKQFVVSGDLNGALNDLNANNLLVKYGNDIAFDGDFYFKGLPDIQNTYIDANINEIRFTTPAVQDLVAELIQHPVVLPNEMHNLGKCRYSGRIKGYLRNIDLKGKLATNAGTINTDVNLKVADEFKNIALDGCVRTKCLHLGKFLPAKTQLGDIAFDVDTKLTVGKKKPLKANADLVIDNITFREHRYENIQVKGDYAENTFTGSALIDDNDLKFDFDGEVDWNKDEYIFNFNAIIDRFRPYALNLIQNNPNLVISAEINSNMNGPNIDQMAGDVTVSNLFLDNDNDFYLQELALTSTVGQQHNISLKSNLINGTFRGEYTFAGLVKSCKQMAKYYFPQILGANEPKTHYNLGNKVDFNLVVDNTEDLAKALSVDWFTPEPVTVNGAYDDEARDFYATVDVPKLRNHKSGIFDGLYVDLNNEQQRINCELGGQVVTRKKDTITCVGNVYGSNDSVTTHLQWSNISTEIMHAGEVLAKAQFFRKNDQLNAEAQIVPTQIVLQNVPFNIGASEIETDFQKVRVKHFSIESDEQHIFLDGVASKSEDDVIDIDLQNISLDFVSTLIPSTAQVSFGGNVSGSGSVRRAFDIPIVVANVSGDSFSFNNSYLGKVRASSWWENDEKCIAFAGDVISDNLDSTAHIRGGYFIPNDSLDLIGHANHLDIAFVEPFMSMILQNVHGTASGDVHVYGRTREHKILVTLDAMAENAQAGIDFLGATFHFNDSIHMTPDKIILHDIDVQDDEGNHAHLDGLIKHNYFNDMDYRIAIDCKNFKALNTTAKDNDLFYGTAYATGQALITGSDSHTDIMVNAATEKKTKLVVPIGASEASENSFITFVNLKDTSEKEEYTIDPYAQAAEKKKNVMKLNLLAHVTPNAEVQIYIDPKSGDVLKATGEGDIRMEYNDETGDFKMYGDYEIEQGSYRFSFQEAIRKEFKVKQGGTVDWSGDPVNPRVNIDGYYQLNASLLDVLDQSYLESSNRTTVPVQCLLNLTGNLSNPNIKFGLNLPNSDEELNRALQTTISTDEMMTREIIYLLVLGKFFTPETMKSTGTMFTQNDLLAVASSTVSAQLNNWASQMFDNWNFGVNFRSTDLGDSQKSNEYEFNFLYTPNNRISINGNVGYRDDNLSASKFIGDFDFEYKLIQSGKLSAKAYTHTNDYKEFKTGLTTQGIGLVYRESFENGKDLVQGWKNSIAEDKKERAERKARRAERKAQRQAEREAKAAAKAAESKNK